MTVEGQQVVCCSPVVQRALGYVTTVEVGREVERLAQERVLAAEAVEVRVPVEAADRVVQEDREAVAVQALVQRVADEPVARRHRRHRSLVERDRLDRVAAEVECRELLSVVWEEVLGCGEEKSFPRTRRRWIR